MLAALHNDLDTIQVLLKYQANVRAQSSKVRGGVYDVIGDGHDVMGSGHDVMGVVMM